MAIKTYYLLKRYKDMTERDVPFYVENLTSTAATLTLNTSRGDATNVEYSTDNSTWSSTAPSVPANGKVYIRANATYWNNGINTTTINCNQHFNVGGNTMSLLYGSSFTGTEISFPDTTKQNIFASMFYQANKLVSAEKLALPATTLTISCYNSMFYNCSSLTTAPALPATTLAESCYNGMFYGCTSLTTAPALPATTLTTFCYASMFYNCSSLTTAPALPATTLAQSCYSQMFNGCTSLTTAPTVLPATTLALSCYNGMFFGCTSLTTAPALPATTLAQSCYSQMFNGCTSLTTAPDLPATTLAQSCYYYMFYNCSNLGSITVGATSWNTNYTSSWVQGVSATGTFTKPTNTTIPTGINGIPSGWTVVNV